MVAQAHPRWRGAHLNQARKDAAEQGSSPLARGSRPVMHTVARSRGLIPAGAGLTCRRSGAPGSSRAHPRWRGAHVPGVRV